MYTAYYIPRDDADWDLVCILADKDEIDNEVAEKLRYSIEGRLAGFGSSIVSEYKKVEGLDPDGFPQILTGEQSQQPEEDFVHLIFPSAAWETLAETLCMDMDSGAIEPALREEIRNAFNQIKYVTIKETKHG